VIRHFTASGVVLSDDFENVLLIRHRKLGCWLYPGGHLDQDEDPVQAAVREVAEETGLTCQVITETRFTHPAATVLAAPFTICVQDIPADAKTGPHQHIDMIYVLRPVSGQQTPQASEVSACSWIPVAGVASYDTPPELPALIQAAAGYARAVGGGEGTPCAR